MALIGQSGAGKTTLADVILGLLKPYEGDVTVEGKSIYASPRRWAEIVGFVPQSVYLTNDTIRKNVAFGLEEAQIDEATSVLDTETESAVMEAIDFLHGKKTLIIIAHRLTTIQNCDMIYEVKNGSISEERT